MCGIVGFFGLGRDSDQHDAWLRSMLATIEHRGPDEFGNYFDDLTGIGTARLSIIDLANGQQPMSAGDGRYWLVFSGEVFNHVELRAELESSGTVFKTRSDTEVLLQVLVRWGTDGLSRLNGQFALAFYDRMEGSLLLARDPLGERPLFFAEQHDGGIVFSSEIKAIFSLPFVRRELSTPALQRAFHLWTCPTGETCFEGVRNLPPGHFAVLSKGEMRISPYSSLPFGQSPFEGSFEEALVELRERLERSVQLRLRSDVPVGTYLSGGLDSSITTYLAQRENRESVTTFSVAFEDERFDESAYQQQLSAHLGTQHHAVRVSHADIASAFEDAVWHSETVLFRTALAPLILLAREVRERGCKVVLTGEGADEAFLGYNIFKETLFRRRFRSYDSDADRQQALLGLYPYLPHFDESRAASLLRFYSQSIDEEVAGLFSHEVRFKNGVFAARLLDGSYDPRLTLEQLTARYRRLYADFDSLSDLERAQLIEYDTLLAGYLLSSQGDRATSAHGVEARAPFLDPELVAFAFRLPVDYRLKGGLDEKHCLKQAFRTVLPSEVVERPKQPYRAPDAAAFLGETRPGWLDDVLSESSLQACSAIDARKSALFLKRIRSLAPEAISPRDDQAFLLLLSTLLLNERFVTRYSPRQVNVEERLVRNVDGREL